LNGRCVYDDGSAAVVHAGESIGTIPPNYLNVYVGKRKRASDMWTGTQKWRRDNRVWKIHTIPNPWYVRIKEAYPHFIHGYSKEGYPVIYEQPGKMKLKELFREGCTIQDMTTWYTFFMEYLSNRVQQDIRMTLQDSSDGSSRDTPPWGFIVVMDVGGVGASVLSSDVLSYLKRAGEINSKHYPLSNQGTFLIKAGSLISGFWSVVKAVLPESAHLAIFSAKKYQASLREYIVSKIEVWGFYLVRRGVSLFLNDLFPSDTGRGSNPSRIWRFEPLCVESASI
jgi:hypothetical protein